MAMSALLGISRKIPSKMVIASHMVFSSMRSELALAPTGIRFFTEEINRTNTEHNHNSDTQRASKYQGSLAHSMKHGKGKLMFPDGGVYSGDYFANKKHGFGAFRYGKSGDEYNGEWVEDRKHGRGRFYRKSEGSVSDGEFVFDLPHGHGIWTYEDGNTLSGIFLDGKIHTGKGLVFEKKGYYIGEWLNGEKHGIGEQHFEDGTSYVGEWYNGKQHGKGVFVSPPPLCGIYEGTFIKGKMQGPGTCTYPNGDMFEGNFKDDLMFTGVGSIHYFDGSSYKGNIERSTMHGDGKFIYPDGSSYDGRWLRGVKHKHGTFTSADGRVFEEEWDRGSKLSMPSPRSKIKPKPISNEKKGI